MTSSLLHKHYSDVTVTQFLYAWILSMGKMSRYHINNVFTTESMCVQFLLLNIKPTCLLKVHILLKQEGFRSFRICLNVLLSGENWAASWQNQRNDCAPSEDSDQPGSSQGSWVLVNEYEPRHDKTKKVTASCEDSDQPWHQPNLIRVFAVRMKKAWVLSYPLSAQQRLWSDWAGAQADLSLRWAHSHFFGIRPVWSVFAVRLMGS